MGEIMCPRYGKPLEEVSELESDVCKRGGLYCMDCLDYEEEKNESSIDN